MAVDSIEEYLEKISPADQPAWNPSKIAWSQAEGQWGLLVKFISLRLYRYTAKHIYLKFCNSYEGIQMPKRKTSISVDDKLWREWINFVVNKTGSARKISEETENAIQEYMQKYKEANKVIEL